MISDEMSDVTDVNAPRRIRLINQLMHAVGRHGTALMPGIHKSQKVGA